MQGWSKSDLSEEQCEHNSVTCHLSLFAQPASAREKWVNTQLVQVDHNWCCTLQTDYNVCITYNFSWSLPDLHGVVACKVTPSGVEPRCSWYTTPSLPAALTCMARLP